MFAVMEWLGLEYCDNRALKRHSQDAVMSSMQNNKKKFSNRHNKRKNIKLFYLGIRIVAIANTQTRTGLKPNDTDTSKAQKPIRNG